MSTPGPNICKASTESDEHQVADIPASLGVFRPGVLTTTHDFYYANCVAGTGSGSSYVNGMGFRNAWEDGPNPLLYIYPNDPFRCLGAIWSNQDGALVSIDSDIYKGQTFRYPNGINRFREMYRYYKVIKSEFSIEFTNEIGYRSSSRWAPIRIGYLVVDNDGGDIPLVAGTSNMNDGVARFMMHPRTGLICGGAAMGPPAIRGFDGDGNTEVTSHTFAPQLTTSITFNNDGGATDPLSTAKKIYWTQCGSNVANPGMPTDQRQVRFYAMTAGPGSGNWTDTGNGVVFLPGIRIKARFTVCWRDMLANGEMNVLDTPPV